MQKQAEDGCPCPLSVQDSSIYWKWREGVCGLGDCPCCLGRFGGRFGIMGFQGDHNYSILRIVCGGFVWDDTNALGAANEGSSNEGTSRCSSVQLTLRNPPHCQAVQCAHLDDLMMRCEGHQYITLWNSTIIFPGLHFVVDICFGHLPNKMGSTCDYSTIWTKGMASKSYIEPRFACTVHLCPTPPHPTRPHHSTPKQKQNQKYNFFLFVGCPRSCNICVCLCFTSGSAAQGGGPGMLS